ncbi:MAG: peptidase domain-containing ABC transporter [Marinilabiliaceae bacterium]|nr:peptidase domain-containing ABC transporter [Marinilabiliaceae bacterium]
MFKLINNTSVRGWKKGKFPFFHQHDAMDCGPSCLRMVAAAYGRTHSLQHLRDISNITRSGVNLQGISDAADAIGLRTMGVRTSFKKLSEKAQLPCIVHWNHIHFAVVYRIEKIKPLKKEQPERVFVYVADPAHGLLKYTEEEFKKCWITTKHNGEEKGIAMLFEPNPYFYQAKAKVHQPLNLSFLVRYLRPYKKLLWQLFFGLIAGSMLQLIFPFLTQAIVDQGIGQRNIGFIYIVLIAQLALVAGRASVDFIRRWILLHISTRVNVSLISDFLVKLMKLPMKYFETKLVGDLIQRIDDHKRIESFLTLSLLSITLAAINLLVFGIVLAVYDIRIFVVFLVGSGIYAFWVKRFMKKRADLDHKNFAQMASHQSNLIQLVQGMQEIKLTGSEQQKRWEWEGIQAEIFKIKMSSLSLGQWQQGGAVIINEIKNVLITFVSASAVLSGGLTLGAMLAIQYIIGQLHGPIEQLVGFMQQAQDANLSLERMGEIHGKEDEETVHETKTPVDKDAQIEIKNLSFQYYGPRSPVVLNNVTLHIPSGKTTAIVGSSGSGKTTLLKLLLGFYPPTSGEITIGTTPLYQISFKEWRSYCGVVMQDGYIFYDTIAGNIASGIDDIDTKNLLYAVTVANIREHIESLPLKYNTKIGNDGQSLSQGQRQRILIARAVYKNPQFIFFDEATNALDARNERIIMENLDKFFKGRTVIVVAHRLSTVKNADQIVVLHKGEVAEIGTHAELVSKRGAYYELVSNQLELGN